MRLLVYEHACASGFSDEAVSLGVLCEGFGMLRTLIEDLKNAGHQTTTVLDSQIADFHPPLEADKTIVVHSTLEAQHALENSTKQVDAVYVIAPETDGILEKIVEKTEQTHTTSVNCTAHSIREVSNKANLQKKAEKIGLSTPKTIAFTVTENHVNIATEVEEKLGFPAVFKPLSGVGCEKTHVTNNKKQAKTAIKNFQTSQTPFLAQQFIKGTPASVSLISNSTEATPIALNKQLISLENPDKVSSYQGGTTPFNHEKAGVAFKAAKRLVESIIGLKGYVGVDLILTEAEPVILEVNPRLTTSYVGIRKIIKTNIAQEIINAILTKELPAKLELEGYAFFEKVKTAKPTKSIFQQTLKDPAIVSPPFLNPNADYSYSLLCSQGSTMQLAKRQFSKAKKQLNNLLNSGGKTA